MSDKTLLPPNATRQERAIDQTTARIGSLSVPIKDLWNPATCPTALLPWLAWALSVDAWDANWSEARQRRAIAASVPVHKRKGTVGAVKRALAAIDYNIQLVEWHQESEPGTPYTFRADVVLEDRGLSDTTQQEILRLIESTKNARSHLSALRMIGSSQGHAYVAGWEQSFDSVSVQPLLITQAEVPPSPYYLGATVSAYDTTTLEPL
ncbi:phage tail protein I [Vreelandella neptunia]|uniref:Phage tail protein I n=1 Tax=Vreelandella neptunia TaxID=115551 RepID=A0ABZ0YI91_9GAMM|nr:phage tail protein I [Halomonas neptunia]MDN3562115.1 phage tail protein I [Halomonas neptunia]WQH11817.1 phage tail protein I [Halomonas neptunia]